MKKRKRRMTTDEKRAVDEGEAGPEKSWPPGHAPFVYIKGGEVSDNVWEDVEIEAGRPFLEIDAKKQKGNRVSRVNQLGRKRPKGPDVGGKDQP